MMLRPIPEKPADSIGLVAFDTMAAGSILGLFVGFFSGEQSFYALSFVFLFSSYLGLRDICTKYEKVYETMNDMISYLLKSLRP